jgi:hypothetical protein
MEDSKKIMMDSWIKPADELDKRDHSPCGTAGCIAAWAVLLSGGKVKGMNCLEWRGEGLYKEAISFRAKEILGLSISQASNLFYPNRWPEQYLERLHRWEPGEKRYAKVVCDKIDHFIKTKGAE